ncbi:MAG: M48 family metallopeptidase [Rickettsiales bacterium]
MKLFHHLFLAIMCACLTACQSPTAYTPELTQEEISAEEISQQKMVDKIQAQGGLPKAWQNHKNMRKQFERVGMNIEKAGAEICRELHLQKNGCYYYFKLARNEAINSKADGENIVIFTGMMRFAQSDDELAVVMAHEFTHNLMGHVRAQKNNATFGMLFGMAADALADSQGINMGGEMTKVGTEIGTLTYSVSFEKEADYIGLYVLARAGYDINRAPELWRRMSIEDPDAIYSSITHPSNPARFVALQKAVTEIEYKRKHHIPLLPDFKAGTQN